ncbi:MAG: hypothetical protein Q4C01_03355 [Clostridia bacterium]|nr:hypothetical protein [Clostridia bacterium]
MTDIFENPNNYENPAGTETKLTCPNCGFELDAGQEFCHKCGCRTALAYEISDSIEAFNFALQEKKKGKKKKTLIIIAIVLVVLVVGGVAGYFLYFEPNSRYAEALELYENKEYEEAAAIFTELGGFKDSEARAESCDNAIKQEKYDAAIAKASDEGKYGEAIEILTELGDFLDSEEKIAEYEADYFEALQYTYAFIQRGYFMDFGITLCVIVVLNDVDTYNVSSSIALSHLYEGTSYSTYYYNSLFDNGYATVVSSSAAEEFVSLLDATAAYNLYIISAMELLANPPERYEALYEALTAVYDAYAEYHSFANTSTSLSSSAYISDVLKYTEAIDVANTEILSLDERIDDIYEEADESN